MTLSRGADGEREKRVSGELPGQAVARWFPAHLLQQWESCRVGRRTFAPVVPGLANDHCRRANRFRGLWDCVSEDEDERAEAPAAWKLYSCSFTEDQSVSLVAAVCSLKA